MPDNLTSKNSVIQDLHFKILQTIENAGAVTGLKSDEFQSLKTGIIERCNELVEKGVLEITAPDKEVRPHFVALQAIIEQVLANELNKSIHSLIGVTHTPTIATPLYTEGSVSEELVDPYIMEDPLRLFTVKVRPTIIRDYLFKGGDFYMVYPQKGISKRSENQQQIYRRELENYPAHLFDYPLTCESIDNDLIGAFYLFKNNEGKNFGFAIKMKQANSPQDLDDFGLWLGEINHSPVQERIFTIINNVLKYTSQPIALPL